MKRVGVAMVCGIGLTAVLVGAADGAPMVSVLQKGGRAHMNPTPPPPYARLLAEHGIRIGFPEQQMRAVKPVTWAYLQKFNVVVVPTLRGWVPSPGQTAAQYEGLLDRHMRAGGGVLLFNLAFIEGPVLHEAANKWLAKYGARFVWEEIEDKAHTYADPPRVPWQYGKYQWTTNIARTPITEGIKTIYYAPGHFRGPHMVPMSVDKSWQVLVRAEPSAQAYALTDSPADFYVKRKKDAKPRPAGAVPLLAVRQVGKGRLAVFGGSPAPYWYDLGKEVHARVIQQRGDGVRRSDWIPLLVNVLRWLSEPARAAGKPGGYDTQVAFRVRPDWGNRTPIDWEKIDRDGVSPAVVQQTLTWHSGVTPQDWKDWGAGKYRPFKVLIGAHTKWSGGTGTVAEWKAAAQKHGYHAVIFRENVLGMSRKQWDAFKAACKKASDDTFLAIAGQTFQDWIGNRFMRYNPDLKYPLKERLTPDGKRVIWQLQNFFDTGWPCNFPYLVKQNPTRYWNYRVYDAWPVAVYRGGKLVEDNSPEWAELVDNYEYSSPIALHLLERPAEVARAATQKNTYMMGKALADVLLKGRIYGSHNNPRIFTSDGPVIDRFHALNMYRTTLGSRGVAGSHRYRVFIKVHSDKPIRKVELWGDAQCLRAYRPNKPAASYVVEELHDRGRGLRLRVEDAAGRVAVSTGIMVHDKMMWFVWCGDHCNALPSAIGLDPDGNPGTLGLGTRVKSSFQGMDGPGTNGYDMWRFVPWGTDTSSPATGLMGDPRLVTDKGLVPAAKWWYTSRVCVPLSTRDVLVQQLQARCKADWPHYRKTQPAINGWYPYTKNVDTELFTVTHEDADLHRNVADPMFQHCSGTFTFKKPVTLAKGNDLTVRLTRMNFNHRPAEAYGPTGRLGTGTHLIPLKAGQSITWPSIWGAVTVYSLDGHLVARVGVNPKYALPQFGYRLPGRAFKPGDTLRYRFLILRWPMGMDLSERLDVKVAATLNLAGHGPTYTVQAKRGRAAGTQFFLDLETKEHGFSGTINKAALGSRLPVRARGLNPNWTACVWWTGKKGQLLVPISPRADGGPAITQIDPTTEFGPFFVGNVVTCDAPALVIRVLQRSDGKFDVVAHNPTDKPVRTTLVGAPGGPIAGWQTKVALAAGDEKRLHAR